FSYAKFRFVAQFDLPLRRGAHCASGSWRNAMNTKTTENDVFFQKSQHFSQPPILGGCRTRNARPYEAVR
ncbi:MAG: hypothetical protein J6K89_08190, partial [Oscillospiraceae bacterium]|nr:hypothetical protein [Oscillospiraceae bacterium]